MSDIQLAAGKRSCVPPDMIIIAKCDPSRAGLVVNGTGGTPLRDVQVRVPFLMGAMLESHLQSYSVLNRGVFGITIRLDLCQNQTAPDIDQNNR
ncbi:hypothetical protein RRG08_002510 [Elysia crispata]|uniref:Uncharacterized protein n=1 Tax=Elysia crispata TaxID=231223 RepID=A0AAE1DUK4_9GAST|nr:hypothetical protein RRG08_002510 [Elysia crispata]